MRNIAVLLSIKPVYANKIFSSEKKYEFRRKIFQNKQVKIVFVYATAPINKIVGMFFINKIIKASPQSLWKRFRKKAGIDQEGFFKYFKNAKKGFALEIGKSIKFDPPIDPYLFLTDFKPPQSFKYIKTSDPLFVYLMQNISFNAPCEPWNSNKLSKLSPELFMENQDFKIESFFK